MVVYMVVVVVACAATSARASTSVRHYAHRLTIARWHSETQWRDLDAIVTPESSWNPCAYNPASSDCFYRGSSSCGIPQANPCPWAWRGQLWVTRFAQVRWLLGYVGRRYGSPSGALAFRRTHGWY